MPKAVCDWKTLHDFMFDAFRAVGVPDDDCEIVVEVTAAHNVITLIVFSLHIVHQHSHLRGADLIASAVRRAVNVVYDQLLAAIYRNAGNAVAAVKVKELGKRGRYRE